MEGIDTIPNTDADNALILGTALHTGIEEGVEQALDFYKNSFPVPPGGNMAFALGIMASNFIISWM